jgi:hypothetical protein
MRKAQRECDEGLGIGMWLGEFEVERLIRAGGTEHGPAVELLVGDAVDGVLCGEVWLLKGGAGVGDGELLLLVFASDGQSDLAEGEVAV